ncbi:hypothetical protein MMC25_000194 [Agyrium rufum]|nr:hypothetical protein [Agyrium rufum]
MHPLLSRSLRSSITLGRVASLPPRSSKRWRSNPAVAVVTAGTQTPYPDRLLTASPISPFYFETGYALYAKRASRPFPPPFFSPPSGSYSDPLSTHHRSRDRRPYVNGELIRGITNGDDAVLVSDNFIGANDGVGAWATRPNGHAGLWSRLILHFWALEREKHLSPTGPASSRSEPDPIEYLQQAYEETVKATATPTSWQGTTTTCAALLLHDSSKSIPKPLVYVTNLGDSRVMILRPKSEETIFKTTEQWHWFDCPRQLGTNSPDRPDTNAVLDKVEIEEGDVVLAMTDGVTDNLWDHEITKSVFDSLNNKPEDSKATLTHDLPDFVGGGIMLYVANQLMKAARIIAEDPFAESPFMERAVEEGLALEGGKLDDISVVAAMCKKRES